ncbi:TolC family protein [Curvibacter sp. RS43]|uniref:TolC family protein n=1 Tax=Curvibacter microcysteis TaxID=3026419 RepID=A0ABT5M9N6_9BURK|nr:MULTISPECIES: TolC family protein [unclassified Curvibacter]MDD0812177.1 TolC family protein [Curvibacter sp. RS43]MDD0813141.1 TolC family protein [Curvibacter sp. HBC28]
MTSQANVLLLANTRPSRLAPTWALSLLTAACLAWSLPSHAQSPSMPAAQAPSADLLTLPQAPTEARPAAESGTGAALTLEQLTRTVLAHNPELLAAQRARNTAAAGVISAGALPNPKLEWSGGRNNARLASATPGQVQSWALAQLIENPSLRSARQDAARAGERSTAEQIEQTRNELISQVHLRAYEALLRRAEAAAAQESVLLLEQVRERVRLRVDSGEAPRYEMIKADAEIINARQRQQNASLQAEQALLTLNRLAAGQLPARWSLQGSLDDDPGLPGLEETRVRAEQFNPELRALQAEVNRAQARLAEAKASRLPGVELRYSQTRDPEIRQQQVGVSMQIPLFDQRTGPTAEASSELERLQGRLDGRRAELRQQILLAWKSLEIARVRTEALSLGAVREAEAALRVAQAAYRFGERGILDVLDAQRLLRSVRADLLEARYQQQAARIELELLAARHAESYRP